jgi:hypothetical protein
MPRRWSRLFVAALAACASACELTHFLPHTLATAVSPDGRHTAIVRRAFSIDPPDDHLFIATKGQAERNVLNLGPDVDWCRSIVWSPDSRKAGFVINDEQLAIVDAETGRLDVRMILTGDSCCGSAQYEAQRVAFNEDATEVSFDRVQRATIRVRGEGGKEFEVGVSRESLEHASVRRRILSPARILGRETVRVPTADPPRRDLRGAGI